MRPEILLSLENLRKNVELLQGQATSQKLFPVIKANAYGHGSAEIARMLVEIEKENHYDFPFFCVAQMQEAKELRAAGVKKALLVLSQIDLRDFDESIENVSLVLSSFNEIEALLRKKTSLIKKLNSVHMKFNTGMNRLGFSWDLFENSVLLDRFSGLIKKLSAIKPGIVQGVMSHLAKGEKPFNDFSALQCSRFVSLMERLDSLWDSSWGEFPRWRHLANSPGILNQVKESQWINAARPGLHLYGVWGGEKDILKGILLKPVLKLVAPLKDLYWIKKGEFVGYSLNFQAARDTLLGIVNLGYADGVRREFSVDSKKQAYFCDSGVRFPILGNISMDMTAIDLTLHKDSADLDRLRTIDFEFIGSEQSAEILAEQLNTISYEILTSLSPRILRKIV